MSSARFFLFFVFITGAAIMMIEMAAFKATVPYFGSSLYVWANIIGIVMIALSLGYYLGGKIADRRPDESVLMYIVLSAGVLAGSIPFLTGIFTEKAHSLLQYQVLSSIIYLFLFFAPPLFFLAMVSPFVIRLQNRAVETTGNTAGSIYSFATVGSIFGTYLASFGTLPWLGSRATFLIAGSILSFIALVGLIKQGRLREPSKAVFIILLIIPFVLSSFPWKRPHHIVYSKESFYGFIEVGKGKDDSIYLDANRSGRLSVYHPDKVLTGLYFDYFIPLYYLLEESRVGADILIIGHAGGVISRQYSHFFGGQYNRIDGVELDPEITALAYKFFDIGSHKNLRVINQDGRIFLEQADNQHSLIFVDAYYGAVYLPFQLATKEFFELVRHHLKDNGILAMNVVSRDLSDRVARCVTQTMRTVFPYVYMFKPQAESELNIAIAASTELKLDERLYLEEANQNIRQELSPLIERMISSIEEVRPAGNCLLTDDRSPTELLRELDLLL